MKKALMTMGLPGSGKSTVLTNNFNVAEYTLIDPDAIKKEHADYDDNNPSALHDWSKKEADARIARAIANDEDIIIDGTGTNSEKMVQNINRLQSAGYHVTVVYVKVKLSTALKRNAERARTVPEALVREKADLIATAVDIVSGYADEMKVIKND